MEENKSEMTVQAEQPLAMSPAKKPKILFIVVGLVVLVLLVVFGFLFFNNNKNIGLKEPLRTESIQADVLKGSEYITTQKTENGAYWYQKYSPEVCPMVDGKMACSFRPNNLSFGSNSWAALGQYSAYKISLDKSYLDNAKSDLDNLLSWCEDSKNDCTYLLSQPIVINEDLKDARVTEFLEKQGEKLIENKPEEHLMLSSIEVKELAQLYGVFKDEKFLKEATKRLAVVEKNLQKESVNPQTGAVSLPNFTCWVSLAQVELGKAKNDQQIIVNAIEYLKQNDRINTINNFANPVMIQPCIEAFFLAGKTTPYGYAEQGKEMFKEFLANFYESDGYTTYFSKEEIAKGQPKNIFLADTAYTNYLKYLSVQ